MTNTIERVAHRPLPCTAQPPNDETAQKNIHKVRAGWTILGQAIGHKPFRTVDVTKPFAKLRIKTTQTAHRAFRHTHACRDVEDEKTLQQRRKTFFRGQKLQWLRGVFAAKSSPAGDALNAAIGPEQPSLCGLDIPGEGLAPMPSRCSLPKHDAPRRVL